MKRCPKCKRQYDDETLRFCLEDGSPLFSEHDSKAPATEIMPPRGGVTNKSSGPTVPSYLSGGLAPSEERIVRQANPLLTAGVIAIAVLLLALVGIAGFFALKQSGRSESTQVNRSETPSVRQGSITSTNNAPATTPGRDEGSSASTETSGNLKITATASSVRLALQANTYYASNAIDGKRATAWIEGVDGPGLGEWIRFDLDREINLHRILVQPGYFKTPQIWAENNRLASVTAQFSDGTSRELKFTDTMETQKIEVGSIRTRWVKFIIRSIYYGSNPGPSDDTALSEVAFEWD